MLAPRDNGVAGATFDDLTTRAYNGEESLKLYDGHADVTVINSIVYHGYIDRGTRT